MRYLKLAAEYSGSPLRDEWLGEIALEDGSLPPELAQRVRDWNARYRQIIPLDAADRREPAVALLIRGLDEEGLGLAAEILSAMGEAKVRYYSEGLLRLLP